MYGDANLSLTLIISISLIPRARHCIHASLLGPFFRTGSPEPGISDASITYYHLPPHVLVHVDTTLFVEYDDLDTDETINFTVSMDGFSKVIANVTGGANCEDHPFWTKVGIWCRFDTDSISVVPVEWTHSSDSLTVHIEAISSAGPNGSEPVWAFSALCLDQSFKITKAPSQMPTQDPTALPTPVPSADCSSTLFACDDGAMVSEDPYNNCDTVCAIQVAIKQTCDSGSRIEVDSSWTSSSSTPTECGQLAAADSRCTSNRILVSDTHGCYCCKAGATWSINANFDHYSYGTTEAPTESPTYIPTRIPTHIPTDIPTDIPTGVPTKEPTTNSPTQSPATGIPTGSPTIMPTTAPTLDPTFHPSPQPTSEPSKEPTSSPSIEPSPEPTATPSQPPTNAPTVASSSSPTSHPTDAPSLASNETRAVITVRDSNFTGCNFECIECLYEVDSTKRDYNYTLSFSTGNASNSSCECPTRVGTENATSGTIEVDYGQDYSLTITQDDNETISVSVMYWNGINVSCSLEYDVQENEFLSVEAKNSIVITFVVCGIFGQDGFNQTTYELELLESFEEIFNDSNVEDVDLSIERGSFCEESSRRRLLSDGDDAEVTVVVVFTSADDATDASSSACDEAALVEPSAASCDVVVTDASSAEAAMTVTEVEDTSPISDNLKTALIAIAVVVFICLLGIVALYCYHSREKRKSKQSLSAKHTTPGDDQFGGTIARSPLPTTDGPVKTTYFPQETAMTNMQKRVSTRQVIPMLAPDDTNPDVTCDQSFTQTQYSATVPSSTHTSTERVMRNMPGGILMPNGSEATQPEMDEYKKGTDDEGFATLIPKYDSFDLHGLVIHELPGNNASAGNGAETTNDFSKMMGDVIKLGNANEIKAKDIMKLNKVGEGQFGCVYRAKWDGNEVVVKELNSMQDEDDEFLKDQGFNDESLAQLTKEKAQKRKEMFAEIKLASSIPRHNNLVEIFGYIQKPFGVVMNCMAGGSVMKLVYRAERDKRSPKLPLPTNRELCIILKKAASGLKHLHQFELVHRDIACRNILLGKLSNNQVVSKTEVRISDFGLTRQMDNQLGHKAFQKTATNFGPLKWMAPEAIEKKKYGKPSDVYMFGITMWEMFYGMEPYPNASPITVAHGVVHGKLRPTQPGQGASYTEMPDGYYALMKGCWARNHGERPRFDKIIKELEKIEETGFKTRVP